MDSSVSGTGGPAQLVPGVADTTPDRSPTQTSTAAGAADSEAGAPSSTGTALATIKIAFVALVLVTGAALMVLGFTVGAILSLFTGLGFLAVELLKKL